MPELTCGDLCFVTDHYGNVTEMRYDTLENRLWGRCF